MVRNWLLCLLLTACGTTTSQPIITSVIQPNAPVAVQKAQPMTLNSVQWQVMSLPELEALVKKLQVAKENKIVLFVLNAQDYTNLASNFVEIERYLKEQQAIIDMLTTIINSRSQDQTKSH